jgi:hypothetical protein
MAANVNVMKRSLLLAERIIFIVLHPEGLKEKKFDAQHRFFSTLREDDVRDITSDEFNQIFYLKHIL